jgi:hypothetical protein
LILTFDLASMSKILLILSFLCAAVGCADSDESLQVTGTVKLADGSPVTGESGTVAFHPAGEGQAASGAIQPDGSFEAMTKRPGDGMQPGDYKVTLHVFKNYREQTLAVPERYADETATPLTATVDADNTHFDFIVER